jgi:hypothetical protein
MKAESLSDPFDKLSTALIADAALRLKVPFRISPPGLGPVTPNQRLTGPGAAGQTFWKRRHFPRSNAKRAPR